jgi:hypothetical protein
MADLLINSIEFLAPRLCPAPRRVAARPLVLGQRMDQRTVSTPYRTTGDHLRRCYSVTTPSRAGKRTLRFESLRSTAADRFQSSLGRSAVLQQTNRK